MRQRTNLDMETLTGLFIGTGIIALCIMLGLLFANRHKILLLIHKSVKWGVKNKLIPVAKKKRYAVEVQVMLDENTIVHKFAAEIDATSKRHAKWELKQRAFLRISGVVDKAKLIKYNK